MAAKPGTRRRCSRSDGDRPSYQAAVVSVSWVRWWHRRRGPTHWIAEGIAVAFPAQHAIAGDADPLQRRPQEGGHGAQILRDHLLEPAHDPHQLLAELNLIPFFGGRETTHLAVDRSGVSAVAADGVVDAEQAKELAGAAGAGTDPGVIIVAPSRPSRRPAAPNPGPPASLRREACRGGGRAGTGRRFAHTSAESSPTTKGRSPISSTPGRAGLAPRPPPLQVELPLHPLRLQQSVGVRPGGRPRSPPGRDPAAEPANPTRPGAARACSTVNSAYRPASGDGRA